MRSHEGISESPECVDEAVGVFVSVAGDDANDGTRGRPFRTIGKGVEARGDKPRVYVCEGTYEENVRLLRSVGVHGGLACDWTHSGAKPTIAPSEGTALEIRDARGVIVEDMEAVAVSDAARPGQSVVAVLSVRSEVTFRRVSIVAGDAQEERGGPMVRDGRGSRSAGDDDHRDGERRAFQFAREGKLHGWTWWYGERSFICQRISGAAGWFWQCRNER